MSTFGSPSRLEPNAGRRAILEARMAGQLGVEDLESMSRSPSNAGAATGPAFAGAADGAVATDAPAPPGTGSAKKRPRRKPEHPSRMVDPRGSGGDERDDDEMGDGIAGLSQDDGDGGGSLQPSAKRPRPSDAAASTSAAGSASRVPPGPMAGLGASSPRRPGATDAGTGGGMWLQPSYPLPAAVAASVAAEKSPPATTERPADSNKVASKSITWFFQPQARGGAAAAAAATGSAKPLAAASQEAPAASSSAATASSGAAAAGVAGQPAAAGADMQALIAAATAPLHQEVARLRNVALEAQRSAAAAASQGKELASLRDEAARHKTEAETLRHREEAAARERDALQASWHAASLRLCNILRERALKEATEARRELSDKLTRLGRVVPHREGTHMTEVWEPGEDYQALALQEAGLKAQKEELERQAREVIKRNAARRRAVRASNAKAAGSKTADAAGEDDEEASESEVAALLEGSSGASATGAAARLAAAAGGAGGAGATPADVQAELDLVVMEESVKAAIAALKREEVALASRRAGLDTERAAVLLEVRRQRQEAASPWRTLPLLGDRYLLTQLLGKGGFSEVWKAVDILEVQDVAVKIHQLAAHWTEEKKAQYVKHALREHEIQRQLIHPHVVRLLQVISINDDCFATVLEHCKGSDLDRILKQHGTLPEREARAIIIQVLAALRYFNGYASPWSVPEAEAAAAAASTGSAGGGSGTGSSSSGAAAGASSGGAGGAGAGAAGAAAAGSLAASTAGAAPGVWVVGEPPRNKIIHYDLKPANILFDEYHNVKLTDFGLSKIIQGAEHGGPGEGTSLELTSQGAGTYWYLPPECFLDGNVRISNKVDVWSVGVIFYQMLFGRRPFGEGQTQEQILAMSTILQQSKAGPQFPAKTQVSVEARNFIRRCLTPEHDARPDVMAISEDPYLRLKMRQ